MNRPAYIFREKRLYNKWAATQTLEDYALRYTADSARRWSTSRVANTAIGATAFLACEAIGAWITLNFGFANSVTAIGVAVAMFFLVGLPIAYYSAKEGLDVDLLTRGAGFGYLGSTITSLIYASFTFLLFAVEASIMSVALTALLGVSLPFAYLISSLVVIPIAIYGMSAITRFQGMTQPLWVVLQLAPIGYLLWKGVPEFARWSSFPGEAGGAGLALVPFGLAFSTLLSLLPQIGEQADYLRFLPARREKNRRRWWLALLAGGPGWALIGGVKLLLGSLLAVYLVGRGTSAADARDPMAMFGSIFAEMFQSESAALILAGVFVIVCQMKINVTNAYAGSIAWSNFFARLTHAHPGRVVWLVFNVLLALLLMELGMLEAIGGILVLYASLAAGWIGALASDLVISKPLGLSPAEIEFRRAHLYDINPVGTGALALSILVSGLAHLGVFGPIGWAFAPLLGFTTAFVAAPAIAFLTRGRYYIARPQQLSECGGETGHECVICENHFQTREMAHCPFYSGPICSLCCVLETRCQDRCKTDSRATEQIQSVLRQFLPDKALRLINTTIGHFLVLFFTFEIVIAGTLWLIGLALADMAAGDSAQTEPVLRAVFIAFSFLAGIAAWGIVLAHHSRRAAQRETDHHTQKLVEEIAAHQATDRELQAARDNAEAANTAKTRFLVNVSHEIRSPLNSIYGYAQLLERGTGVDPRDAGQVISRSAEHLTALIEGLLDISQVESGVLRISRDVVPLPTVLQQIVSMFQLQAQTQGVGFRYVAPPNLPQFVRTDEKRLRQVLINLLSNALKFTEEGEVCLKVSYRSELATFEVIDTGIGIEPEDLARIFQPFERGSTPSANRRKGVGLGLSITEALVRIMGGEITVESKPGKGTTFRVRVMLSRVREVPPETLKQEITGYEGPRRSVLLVDDDPNQLGVVRNLLDSLGFNVYTALDGATGLRLAARTLPDIVLLDVNMPGLSGWETAALIRLEHGPAMRIVMVSADPEKAAEENGPPPDYDRFLPKPVEFPALLDIMGELLDIAWTIGAPQSPEPVLLQGPRPSDAIPVENLIPHLEAIQKMATIGHVRGLRAEIKRMRQEMPEGEVLGQRMEQLLDQFDLAAISREIERVLKMGGKSIELSTG